LLTSVLKPDQQVVGEYEIRYEDEDEGKDKEREEETRDVSLRVRLLDMKFN